MMPARTLAAALLLLLTLPLLAAPATSLGEGALGGERDVGRWDPPMEWPVQGEDAILLPTGKVLLFAYGRDAHLWDPRDGSMKPVPTDASVNCVGLALLADGRVLLNGGHAGSLWRGLPGTYLFDPWTETWSQDADMRVGRYYPGTITLADGRVLTVSGNGPDGRDASVPEVYAPGDGWTLLPDAEQAMEFYPRMHVLADGTVVSTGQGSTAWFLDLDDGAWREGPSSGHGRRWGGASVLLPDLHSVLVMGGGSMGLASEGWALPALRDDADAVAEHLATGREPATASAQVLDTRGAGAWRDTGSMAFPRRDFSAVLLPDGQVLAVGGAAGFEPIPGWAEHALAPELYDPETGAWSVLAPSARHRGYHSTALLLPDGRVLASGGDFETGAGSVPGVSRTGEVFHPPYLFRGERPVVLDAPDQLARGAAFDIVTPDADDVAQVNLVRLSAVTHSLNTDQRVVPLDFETTAGGVRAAVPSEPGATPPGWYMLFLVGDEGAPSVARMVRVP